MQPPKGLLFDWDNTLVKSLGLFRGCYEAAMADLTICQRLHKLKSPDLKSGRSLKDQAAEVFGEDQAAAGLDRFYDHYAAGGLEGLTPINPHMGLILGALKKQGVFLGVVSNKRSDQVRREISHLGWTDCFSVIVGSGDAPFDKPHVAPIYKALEAFPYELDNLQEDIWFVGDSVTDITCAYDAGCLPILVGQKSAGDLEIYKPVVLPCASDVVSLFSD
jgi:phosphoglycolate phosphatase